ncbi:magnesium transporter CorA family protein [Leuconostoc fallax]|uniref:Magnesium transport protein CorA n=1 Tax=Leuconostoc fallax TaxID=1251 RepID=A0A4R5NBT8_9LACO|nr:magnesium transporter CorA family protein [Leuconostoc fallax]MBU7456098.1 magnesium transporter CorA family protein [Leuconostoc fallax]TDG70105.1 hypothetical protein C5L23_001629 [Leuconostoc fallax]
MIEILKQTKDYTWFHIVGLTPHDRRQLVDDYELTEEMINYAIDHNESVRVEYDVQADEILMVFDVITDHTDLMQVATQPIGIMIMPEHRSIYTFAHEHTAHVRQAFIDGSGVDKEDAVDLIFSGLYQLVTEYINNIVEINRKRRIVQARISEKHQKWARLEELVQLKTRLIYLQNSLANNAAMLKNFRADFSTQVTAKTLEHIDDVLVEVDQAKTMADLAMDVINSVSDAYGYLSNQELNWTMKMLTVYSIILTMPTIVGGFYGENVALPWASERYSWLITIGITIFLMGVTTFILWRSGFFRK